MKIGLFEANRKRPTDFTEAKISFPDQLAEGCELKKKKKKSLN